MQSEMDWSYNREYREVVFFYREEPELLSSLKRKTMTVFLNGRTSSGLFIEKIINWFSYEAGNEQVF